MASKTTTKRTAIAETWQPSADDQAYAAQRGVNVLVEAESFRDHHLMRGNLMASWPAAWRTWCRNTVKFKGLARVAGFGGGAAVLPLLVAPDPLDPWGAFGWACGLADALKDTIGGRQVLTIGGYDVVATARQACQAAGFSPDWRGDLTQIAAWLREGHDPETIVQVICGCRKPDRPTLRYFDVKIRDSRRSVA